MIDDFNILAEFYPNTLKLIAKKYGFGLGEFRYHVLVNGLFVQQSDIDLIEALINDHRGVKDHLGIDSVVYASREDNGFLITSGIKK